MHPARFAKLMAIEAAFKSDHPRYKLGCCIYNKKRIIGLGWNHVINQTGFWKDYVHAEVDAMLKVKRSVKGATLVVVRLTGKGLGLAKPCPGCQEYIKNQGIKRVFYSNKFGQMEMME